MTDPSSNNGRAESVFGDNGEPPEWFKIAIAHPYIDIDNLLVTRVGAVIADRDTGEIEGQQGIAIALTHPEEVPFVDTGETYECPHALILTEDQAAFLAVSITRHITHAAYMAEVVKVAAAMEADTGINMPDHLREAIDRYTDEQAQRFIDQLMFNDNNNDNSTNDQDVNTDQEDDK